MAESYGKPTDLAATQAINKRDFDLSTLDDHLRVDLLCQELLKRFYLDLLERGESPEGATGLARGADYFVRDFVVDNRGQNIFAEERGVVRQFAGNWYIVNNLDPNIEELAGHLAGVKAFYRYLNARELISGGFLEAVEKECGDVAYYAGRIESFWEIRGDGYPEWERECSLKGSGVERDE